MVFESPKVDLPMRALIWPRNDLFVARPATRACQRKVLTWCRTNCLGIASSLDLASTSTNPPHSRQCEDKEPAEQDDETVGLHVLRLVLDIDIKMVAKGWHEKTVSPTIHFYMA
jgi:hypothetical protein